MKITADNSKHLNEEQAKELSYREALERSSQYYKKEQFILNEFGSKDSKYDGNQAHLGQVQSLKELLKRAEREELQAKEDARAAMKCVVIADTKLQESLDSFKELAIHYEGRRSSNPEIQDMLDEFVEALRSIIGDDK
jgi:hypothetical protein